jgi:hypothetical protein
MSEHATKPIVSITSQPAVMKKNIRNGDPVWLQHNFATTFPECFEVLLEDDLDPKY